MTSLLIMKETISLIYSDTLEKIKSSKSTVDLDTIKTLVLGKKGTLTNQLKEIGKLPIQDRPQAGEIINNAKLNLTSELEKKRNELDHEQLQKQLQTDTVDITQPGEFKQLGSSHPITQTTNEIITIFRDIGYSVKKGPEIETDFYNFQALNIPDHHPARDMHDTFYVSDNHLLRTHTSPVQVHVMETTSPPIQIIVPGRVYRCDSDVSHSPMFHQLEGLVVDKNISFADLKSTLEYFLKTLFGHNRRIRFRPSYFPFTEPSAEVDVECVLCDGSGCSVCKQSGWLEILGCGMVHNNVFKSVNIDTNQFSGFAFGLGIDRIAMLKYKIPSIKLFYENDLRFNTQF